MNLNTLLSVILWIAICTFVIFASLCILASLASVRQEQKIWKDPNLPSLSPNGLLKVFLLNMTWMGLCGIGAILTVIRCLLTGSFSDTRSFAHGQVERLTALFLCRWFVGPVEVRGKENLPPDNGSSPAPVFIANHASQIDAAAVYALDRQFRWVVKASIIFLPGVGQVMWLSKHVFIDRTRKQKGDKSFTGARNVYVQSNNSVQNGVPMFFFPQGTRRLGGRLPFKDGAFKVAKENNTLLVPISIEIPLTAWNSSYPFGAKAVNPVILTVHKPIESTDKDIETLKKESFDIIHSVLPDYTKQS